MLHCHDLMHEDVGVIGWVHTVGGPYMLPVTLCIKKLYAKKSK